MTCRRACNRRRAAFAAGVIGAAALLAGCGQAADPVPDRPSPTPEVAGTPRTVTRTVTDLLGRTVAVGDDVERVATLSPAAADFAIALGLEVVGRSSDTPAAVAPGAQPTGSTLSPDFAAIAALQPDLVLADAAFHSGRTRDFDRFTYPVYVLKANTYPEVLAAFDALGAATDRVQSAAEARKAVEATAERALETGRLRGALGPAPRVLILTGGGRDVFAGGDASYLGDLVRRLGGVNVLAAAADGGPIAGFGIVEVTQAASLLPDVVLILPAGEGGLAGRIRAEAAWAATPAVRDGRVHDLDTGLYLRSPGPRVGEALEGLVGLLWR